MCGPGAHTQKKRGPEGVGGPKGGGLWLLQQEILLRRRVDAGGWVVVLSLSQSSKQHQDGGRKPSSPTRNELQISNQVLPATVERKLLQSRCPHGGVGRGTSRSPSCANAPLSAGLVATPQHSGQLFGPSSELQHLLVHGRCPEVKCDLGVPPHFLSRVRPQLLLDCSLRRARHPGKRPSVLEDQPHRPRRCPRQKRRGIDGSRCSPPSPWGTKLTVPISSSHKKVDERRTKGRSLSPCMSSNPSIIAFREMKSEAYTVHGGITHASIRILLVCQCELKWFGCLLDF